MRKCLPVVFSAFMILICLAAGVWMLVTGIGDTIEEKRLKESYETVEAQLSDYSIDSPGGYDPVRRRHSSATYYLTYTYFVDDLPYTVTTDYSTGDVPALGTPRTVYYDPANPESAILGGTSSSAVLLFGGAMFIGIPMIFILGFCATMGWLPKTRIDFMQLIMGGVLAAMGGGFLKLMEDGTAFHPMKLIPWLMTGVGVLVVIRAIFSPGRR